MKTNLAEALVNFYRSLQPPDLPPGVDVLFPQSDPVVMNCVEHFLAKYYSDTNPRRLLIGINPGRFGGGITGINFTGPRQLTDFCDIDHPFGNSSELSAEFIYEVIGRYGRAKAFYSKFFIAAVSPLGFTRDGVNMNYYDDKNFQKSIRPFVVENLQKLLSYGFDRDKCICIGGEKNFRYLSSVNDEHHFFHEIIPVAHPRYILQYKRKQKEMFIKQYLDALSGY